MYYYVTIWTVSEARRRMLKEWGFNAVVKALVCKGGVWSPSIPWVSLMRIRVRC